MPPRWIRRIVFGPLVPLAVVWLVLSLPLLAIVALIAVPAVPGRWRPLRLLWFTLVYLGVEAIGLLVAFALWVASGFGARLRTPGFQQRHFDLLRWCTGVVVQSARRTFNLVIEVDESESEAGMPEVGRPPVIVLARHAGPGDSFLLVGTLLARGRRPRIVLKHKLQWDPLLDVMLNRLPSRFIPPSGEGRAASVPAIVELAGSMGLDDALVIFPEGGNFSEKRRHRSITKLEELGRHEQADLARQMRHVLAPRTNGTLAAIDACPAADVVFIAHTGLEELSSPVDLWRGLPMDSEVVAKVWRVRPEGIPPVDEREAWLYDWWLTVDRWIVAQRGREHVPDAVAERVAAEGTAPA